MVTTVGTPDKDDVPEDSANHDNKTENHSDVYIVGELTGNPADDSTGNHGNKGNGLMGMDGETAKVG